MFTTVTATISTLQMIPGCKNKIAIVINVVVDSLDRLAAGIEILRHIV